MSNFYGDILPRRGAESGMADGSAEAFISSGRLHSAIDGWSTRYIAKGIVEARPNIAANPGKLAMTGAAVTLEAKVPVAHRLVRFEWHHLTALLADGTDATEAILQRDDSIPLGAIRWRMYYEAASVSSTTVVPFGESYEYDTCTYRVSFNTTNTDWIVPILILQELKP